MKRKACKKCKRFIEGKQCPLCHSEQFVTNWRGRIAILDSNNSHIAKQVGIEAKGEYAIKVQ
jgi:RNA polymerase subunit RPABC4/transcription elongation factor Spt4